MRAARGGRAGCFIFVMSHPTGPRPHRVFLQTTHIAATERVTRDREADLTPALKSAIVQSDKLAQMKGGASRAAALY